MSATTVLETTFSFSLALPQPNKAMLPRRHPERQYRVPCRGAVRLHRSGAEQVVPPNATHETQSRLEGVVKKIATRVALNCDTASQLRATRRNPMLQQRRLIRTAGDAGRASREEHVKKARQTGPI